jgi:MFS transporter, ACS family, tartrate transporter
MSMRAIPSGNDNNVARVVRRKVAWHILPLIFVLYVISYLDRANIGFAKLRMQQALPWSDDVFGWGFGIFFLGYVFLEIPGALLVEHWSARKWFARILFTWGLCSMAMAFVRTPWQFYLARFFLGLAEAGFFPGVIVYFTHWFPRAERGRALAGLVFGVPISLALGARVSGYLLQQDWLSIQGWQWVFLIEGAPAVVMGLALPFLLSDRPHQARWLSPEERTWLEETLARERLEAARAGGVTLWQALRQRTVWLLALGILATNTGGYAMAFWLPTFVENMLRLPVAEAGVIGALASPLGAGPLLASSAFVPQQTDATAALNYLGLIYLCGVVGVWISGQSSDRTGDRKWHCALGQVLTGAFLAVSLIPGQPAGMVLMWLCGVGFFAFFWPSPFWVLPTLTLSSSAAAVSIGFINICANLAGLLGPPLVGRLKTMGFGDKTCLIILSCFYVSGGLIVATIRVTGGKPKLHQPEA